MQHRFLLTCLVMCLHLAGSAQGAEPPAPAPAAAPIVLLKLDDLVEGGRSPQSTVSERWRKVTAFIEDERLKANYGIICESLEGDKPGYIAWLKERLAVGRIEFWNHGYVRKVIPRGAIPAGHFDGTPLDEQRSYLDRGQRLFRDKLGIDLHAFGPHASKTDATTFIALQDHPEITMLWFYGPPEGTASPHFVFARTINLEQPLFIPNPANVQQRYEKYGHAQDYIAMQGHPNQWDEPRFAAFTSIVLYLKRQGCTFMTASEYLATRPMKP